MAEGSPNSTGTPRSPSSEAPGDDVRQRREEEASTAATERADRRAAAQAEDLDKARAAVVDSANMARNTWVLFLSFGTYLAVAVGAVTHRQLFLEQPIRLPLLNVELPLVAFFFVAPGLFLIFHVYTLMHLKLMSDKVQHYNSLVRRLGLDRTTEGRLRLQLPDFMFVQYLAEPSEGWKSLMHCLLVMIAWLTVIVGPVILLLLIQLQFLPYHNAWATWTQRGIIVVDIFVIWRLWPRILLGIGADRLSKSWMRALAGFAIALVIGFSVFIAVFPNEWLYKNWVSRKIHFADLTAFIFEGPVDEVAGRPAHWVSNKLVLPGQRFVDTDALEKIRERRKKQGAEWLSEYAHSLRGRNLVGAVLDEADLRQVDLSGAQLRYAQLWNAHLEGAKLQSADLRDASLNAADLRGALLSDANLQGAKLEDALLQGALLAGAHFQGAVFDRAIIWGAFLRNAGLQGASLKGAWLDGAILWDASLQGASLDGASLDGASLDGARLQGASLSNASLRGASLKGANLQGATLSEAHLQDASLDGASLWRAYGIPDQGSPEYSPRVWGKTLPLKAPTAEELDQLKKDALKGVDNGDVKQRITKALDRLMLEKDVQDDLPDWLAHRTTTNEAAYQNSLAERLNKLACEKESAPFVAQGLITSSRLEAAGPHLQRIAKQLLDAAEDRTTDCPGVSGLSAYSIPRLREWASKVENKTK